MPGHPARFPEKLPEFFVNFLTDRGDLVLDIFAGSNTTGAVAERLGRRWMAFENNQIYLAASAFRFLEFVDDSTIKSVYKQLGVPTAREVILPQEAAQAYLCEPESRYVVAAGKRRSRPAPRP